jgi:DNA polymerase-4
MVEPSLDEAYLDVKIKRKPQCQPVWKKFDCVFFNGAIKRISVNKFVAKIASDYNKPNGQKQ